MHGERDRWTSAVAIAALARRLSGTTTETLTLPEVGHLVAEEAPERLTGLLLASLPDPSPTDVAEAVSATVPPSVPAHADERDQRRRDARVVSAVSEGSH